jgi:hypothetical protein
MHCHGFKDGLGYKRLSTVSLVLLALNMNTETKMVTHTHITHIHILSLSLFMMVQVHKKFLVSVCVLPLSSKCWYELMPGNSWDPSIRESKTSQIVTKIGPAGFHLSTFLLIAGICNF